MAHKTMHGLSNNGMGFIVVIDHKKMLKSKELMVRDPKFLVMD
jgi:uncharacterized protein (DUF302 family)